MMLVVSVRWRIVAVTDSSVGASESYSPGRPWTGNHDARGALANKVYEV
jgi:hypothetical protein